MLTSALLLNHFSSALGIIGVSYASDYGIGEFICYKSNDDKIKAVAHAFWKLIVAENNFSQIVKRYI